MCGRFLKGCIHIQQLSAFNCYIQEKQTIAQYVIQKRMAVAKADRLKSLNVRKELTEMYPHFRLFI